MTRVLTSWNRQPGRGFRGTIYYIGAFAFPAKNASTQRVRANAKLFRDLGFRVVLIGVHEGLGRRVERRGSFARDGFHSLSVNVGKGPIRKAIGRLAAFSIVRILRMRFEAPPAVICYNHVALSQAQIQIYCRLKRIPFSPDATEWYGPSGNFVGDVLKRVDTTIRMRILNRLADGIITTSPFLTRFYASTGKPQVELPTLFDRAEIGVGMSDGNEPISLVFAGNPFNPKIDRPDPTYWKERLDSVIDVVGEANRDGVCANLDIFGVSRERYLSAFGLNDHEPDPRWLKFWGQVPREQVLQATKDADFTIFFREPTRPNIAGFPSKFSESITCGTPVITNPMENIAPFAKEGSNCILMEPADSRRCGDMLRQLSGDTERTSAMKQYCATTDTFDYRSWIEPVAVFVERWLPWRPENLSTRPESC